MNVVVLAKTTMTKVTALVDTILKAQPVASADLGAKDKVNFLKGQSHQLAYSRLSKHGHREVSLVSALNGRYNWFVYDPHIYVGESALRLDVPFFPQTDNIYEPQRTCNTSSCAMCAAYIKPGSIKGDDDYYANFLKGDTTDHDAQTAALRRLGIDSRFYYNLDFADLDKSLDRGRPVVIGILHRGADWAPTGGHMLVVIGRTQGVEPDYICHDPYGNLNDQYTTSVYNGKSVTYSREELRQRWTTKNNKPTPNTGWGRIFS